MARAPGSAALPIRHAVTITDPATAARIAAAVDPLPVAPASAVCIPPVFAGVRLTFSAGLPDPALAVVTESPCATVSVTIDGRPVPTLRDCVNARGQPASSLGQQVLAIAGLG